MTNGKKWMPETSSKNEEINSAILKTMAFFSLYNLPLTTSEIHNLLYKYPAEEHEVANTLTSLVYAGKLVEKNGRYALKDWDQAQTESNKFEIEKRWRKVDRYFWVLSLVPFLVQASIINSLAMGNADQESDIDFFVVTQPNRLYFVRSVIIAVFRLLGVYKTRNKINEQFCFGFYVTSNHMTLQRVLIEGEDPLFAFWFATFAPLINANAYQNLVGANQWIYEYFPNFQPQARLKYIRKKNWFLRLIKGMLEIMLTIPGMILEPVLRRIHIRHTFDLPENHWPTSTTVADAHMLKLHALDPRVEMRNKFYEVLKTLS